MGSLLEVYQTLKGSLIEVDQPLKGIHLIEVDEPLKRSLIEANQIPATWCRFAFFFITLKCKGCEGHMEGQNEGGEDVREQSTAKAPRIKRRWSS